MVVLGEDVSDQVLIDIHSECFVDLLRDSKTAKRGLRRFSMTIAWISSGDGLLGPGLPFLPDEYSSRYLRFLSRS